MSPFCSLLFYHLRRGTHRTFVQQVIQSYIVKLLSPTQYIAEATRLAQKAEKRIYLISIVIADHPNTHSLIDELEKAATRGVEVVVAADVFTFGAVLNDFYPGRYRSKDTRQVQRMVRALKKAGVKFQWLGRQRMTLYNGRTHSKWCVIDDTVFSFGGVNMYQKGVDNVDYMFKLEDASIANRLVDEQKRIQLAEKQLVNYPSVAYEHDEDTILIDGGIVGQSVIYRRACELAEQAEEIIFVSQYCPTGKLARAIKSKKSIAYYNRPDQAEGLNIIAVRGAIILSGVKTSYTRKEYLHAKCIIFTMPDGSKRAITGSHNFAYTGVVLGTREVALETSRPEVIKQLESFIRSEVSRKND